MVGEGVRPCTHVMDMDGRGMAVHLRDRYGWEGEGQGIART